LRALLIYPRFPKTFWSFESVLRLVDRQALMPPLGLITVAALLPSDWELKLVDRNVREVSEDEWAWADIVLFSAMIAQRQDFLDQIREAKRRGKRVVVGGPYPTALPQYAQAAGADYLVLDEGEITVPKFLQALSNASGHDTPRPVPVVIRAGGEKPDVTTTPVPRFDLLDLDAYDMMAVQFSRGCPFLCDFCDIIELYGRRPRTKAPGQLLAELDALWALGWRRAVFVVDDNFIGHKRDVKAFLKELKVWNQRHDNLLAFNTEASIDLAQDAELLQLMVDCRFTAVFIGIETPDIPSLASVRKLQNTRRAMVDSVEIIARAGIRIMAGFIIGFDNEKPGAGKRIVQFVEETAIPTVFLSLLQALPETTLLKRLTAEGRMIDDSGDMTPTVLMNFRPTRPLEEIVEEYIDAFRTLYDPVVYLDRAYRAFQMMGAPTTLPRSNERPPWRDVKVNLKAAAIVMWRQGVVRHTRWKFWHHFFSMLWGRPALFDHYGAVCAHNEHFLEYRDWVRDRLRAGLVERQAAAADTAITASA
jgi:radical SAM superfamily enzyme YgiQ (UPF0313 family)